MFFGVFFLAMLDIINSQALFFPLCLCISQAVNNFTTAKILNYLLVKLQTRNTILVIVNRFSLTVFLAVYTQLLAVYTQLLAVYTQLLAVNLSQGQPVSTLSYCFIISFKKRNFWNSYQQPIKLMWCLKFSFKYRKSHEKTHDNIVLFQKVS